ncbi:hypothetical protein [Streptomyces telluris]|uniref:Uncharacterized protein n=1 Tax=Streptomyces telluris TaxID=2720021 RepID=A0A9X2LJG9_9ACTN|nr:hypothetical protein [Streptomyces telluris]MCQ8772074.1 hypothetical protein [Streptomyces telluris]NJP76638.1 hypothetical protein [Streptomyces telluris]
MQLHLVGQAPGEPVGEHLRRIRAADEAHHLAQFDGAAASTRRRAAGRFSRALLCTNKGAAEPRRLVLASRSKQQPGTTLGGRG